MIHLTFAKGVITLMSNSARQASARKSGRDTRSNRRGGAELQGAVSGGRARSKAARREAPVLDRHRVDGPTMVRGGSRGFTILALGGVIQPLVGAAVPAVGAIWLVLVAAAAFVAAAWSSPVVDVVARQGAASALFGYALIVPVVHMATGSLDPVQVASTSLTAVVIGAMTGVARRKVLSAGTPVPAA